MTFFNKLKWIIGVLMIFVLILGTNLIDRKNFIKVKDSLTSIYQDRLMASEILFNASDELHHIKAQLIVDDSLKRMKELQSSINKLDQLIVKFDKTSLVKSESDILFHFKESLNEIKENVKSKEEINQNEFIHSIDELQFNIKELNGIQLTEGRKQLSKGERAVETIAFFTQIEVYVLIVLAIVILVIIMYQPGKRTQRSSTN